MIFHFSFSSPCTDSFPQHGRRRYTLQYAELILETSFLHRSLESAILLNIPALTLIRAKPFYTSTMENYCYEVCLGKKCWFLIRDERTFSPSSKSWFPKSCKKESIFEHDIQSAEARHFPAVWRMQRRASQNRLRCSQHKHNFPSWIYYFIAAPFALMHDFEGIFKLLLNHYSPC